MRTRTMLQAVAIAGSVSLFATGCLSSGGNSNSGGGSTAAGGSVAAGDGKVTIMFGFGNDQTQGFKDSLNDWASKNNITIDYQQSSSFETLIQTKVAGNDAPDIAAFPQPGILNDFAKKGKLLSLADVGVDVAKVKNQMISGFLSAATVNGKEYGAPVGMNVKSLWWYDKKQFAAKGYAVPKTEAELEALFAKIKSDGTAPLCFGMESGAATGWPATDWIEDYMLQVNGPDVYDKWVKNEIKFDSPEVRKAFDVYNKLVMTDGYTYGGAKGSTSTAFGTALNPMFKTPPGCFTGKQGNFITQKGYFPTDVFQSLDSRVGVFLTPPTTAGDERVLVGGDLIGAFKNDSDVQKVMKYLLEDTTFGGPWAKTGGFLSPNKDFDVSNYPNQTLKDIQGIAKNAKVARFDGSDMMPGKVGAGSFWKGMVDYTAGNASLDDVLKAIDSSWPSS